MGTWSASDLTLKTDGLLAGEGVQVAADGVYFAGDRLGGAGMGGLEEHVLHKGEMPQLSAGSAAGAGFDPYTHSH